MSALEELACAEHAERGYDNDCAKCVANVAQAAKLESVVQPANTRLGLLVVASPTIARQTYWALESAIKLLQTGRPLCYEEHIARLTTIKDLMQDCVEKLR